MPTTTIRIEDDLKARVAAAAQRGGKTAHAFILDAITQTVEQVELDEAFHRVADERWAKVLATGKTVPWDDAKAWLEARSRGERPHHRRLASPGLQPAAWLASNSRRKSLTTLIAFSTTWPIRGRGRARQDFRHCASDTNPDPQSADWQAGQGRLA